MSTARLISIELQRRGPMTSNELAALIKTKPNTIRCVVNRGRQKYGFYIADWRSDQPVWCVSHGQDDAQRMTAVDAVLAWLEQHGPASGARIHAGLAATYTRSAVDNAIKCLRRSDKVHVCDWWPQREVPGKAAGVYTVGPGPDAPKPVFPKSRGWEERQKRLRQTMAL